MGCCKSLHVKEQDSSSMRIYEEVFKKGIKFERFHDTLSKSFVGDSTRSVNPARSDRSSDNGDSVVFSDKENIQPILDVVIKKIPSSEDKPSTETLANVSSSKKEDSSSAFSKGKITDKYRIDSKRIGKGHYAVVYSGIDKTNNRRVAIKKINKNLSKEVRLAVEVEILKRVKGHPNIVRLFDVYETPTEVQLVMELVNGGELFEHLINEGPYSEAEAAYHMRRIASAIEYLHSLGIVHRDLKPENLLLTSRNPRFAEVKVADFGLAKICDSNVMKTVCGTWAYCAPEVKIKGVDYGPKVDIWSLGVILYILLVAYHPFDPSGEASDEEMWEDIVKGNYNFSDRAWDEVSEDARDLIKNLIMVDPEKRFTARQMLEHPWLASANHCLTPLSPTIATDLANFMGKRTIQKPRFPENQHKCAQTSKRREGEIVGI